MTPIFSRSWLMNTTAVRDRLIAPASLRSAWLISRAWSPGSDVRGGPTLPLGMRHHVQRQRGLAARFRPEDLRHPAPRNPPDADRRVEVDGARGNRFHPYSGRVRSHPHDGALAARLLDLR